MLGSFRVLSGGQAIDMRSGGKTETLLSSLAIRPDFALPRETLLDILWPEQESARAGQSLNSLVNSLQKLLGQALGGAAPVIRTNGTYRLHVEAGVGVDIADFDATAREGDRHAAAGDLARAIACYDQAIRLYHGDLRAGVDAEAIVERERVRARYLNLRAFLADHSFRAGDYEACLEHALQLLRTDPCREDAHRLAMRCYMRRGERAQALRQFRLCEEILRAEFDAGPEPATCALFDQVRQDPDSV
jgi:DNA-binding SARP family transcriptional activator